MIKDFKNGRRIERIVYFLTGPAYDDRELSGKL
jgi:hypothetical protein